MLVSPGRDGCKSLWNEKPMAALKGSEKSAEFNLNEVFMISHVSHAQSFSDFRAPSWPTLLQNNSVKQLFL